MPANALGGRGIVRKIATALRLVSGDVRGVLKAIREQECVSRTGSFLRYWTKHGVRRFAATWQASARNPRSYPYPLVGNMPEATVADVVRTDDVVALEAGGLPAFILLDTRIIELQGLTDRQLARASVDSVADPQFGKRNWVEVLRRRPHFIKMYSSIWRDTASNRRAAPFLNDYHVVLTTMPIPIEHFHDYYYYRVVNPRAHTLLVRIDHPGLPRLRETHPHCSMAKFLRRNGSCS